MAVQYRCDYLNSIIRDEGMIAPELLSLCSMFHSATECERRNVRVPVTYEDCP